MARGKLSDAEELISIFFDIVDGKDFVCKDCKQTALVVVQARQHKVTFTCPQCGIELEIEVSPNGDSNS